MAIIRVLLPLLADMATLQEEEQDSSANNRDSVEN